MLQDKYATYRETSYRFHDFEVDLAARTLRHAGHPVEIDRETFALLALLIAHAPQAMSKAELTAALWPGAEVEESNLGQQIFLLRRALTGSERGEKIIAAERGGYRFAAQLIEMPAHQGTEVQEAGEVLRKSRTAMRRDSEEMRKPRPARARAPRIGMMAGMLAMVRDSRAVQIVLGVGALVVAAAAMALVWRQLHPRPVSYLNVVVAALGNTTGDEEFDSALRTALVTDLRQSPYLIMPGEDKVVAALVAMNADASAAGAGPMQRGIPRELCSRLKSSVYLTGEVRRLGQKYLLTVDAYDCASGKSVASARGIADSPSHLLGVLDKVAAALRSRLGEADATIQRFNQPLFPAGAASLPALKAYADGAALALDGKSSEALTLLQRAVAIDPQFALAYEEMGLVESAMGQQTEAAANLSRANQLRDTVNAFDRFGIVARFDYLVNGDLQAGLRNFKEAIESYPRSPFFLNGLADLENRVGRPALAMDAARQAVALEPDDVTAYEVLAEAQMRSGQFEEAALTCRRTISRGIDTAKMHSMLLQIAFLRLDQPGIDEQLDWARGKPQEPEMLVQQGLMAMAQGKVKSAQPLFARAVEGLRGQGLNDEANDLLHTLPRRYAELGLLDLADSQLERLPQSAASVDLAVALAETGETERADAMLQQGLSEHPAATMWQQIGGPEVHAAIDLEQHRPEAAIEDLQAAQVYDLAGFDVPAMRGKAYLAAHQPALAEDEFHKILDHPGIEPLSQNYALAQLGVARALAAEGKMVEAGFAYKIVLQIWKDADPDLPRLRDAKAEYARLDGEPDAAAPLKPAAAKPRRR